MTRLALAVSGSKTTRRLSAYGFLDSEVVVVFELLEVVVLLQPMLLAQTKAATRSNAMSFFTVGPSFQV